MFAYIPARIGSKRIKKKNIRILDGLPLIVHVIRNLSKVKSINRIAVSTDSNEILEICEDFKNVDTLETRKKELSNDSASFIDLIKYDLPRYCNYYEQDKYIFCLSTSVLVSNKDFHKAIKKFQKAPNGMVMSVVKYDISPYLALEKISNRYVPIFPDKYTIPTSDLPEAVCDCGCFYVLNHKAASNVNRLIDIRPLGVYILNKNQGIDLDNEADWNQLKISYSKINKMNPH